MTAAQLEDPEGHALVEAIHQRKAAATECTCDWYSQDAGGGYFEMIPEPNPDCPQHFPAPPPAPFDFNAPLPPLNIRTVTPWDTTKERP